MTWIMWTILGTVIGIAILLFVIAWSKLGPSNHWFTFVKEGTAKIIVRGDAAEKCLIQWKGCIINKDWDVVAGREMPHFFGGFRIYSLFYPIFDVYIYRLRWSHLHEDGIVVTHDEWLDYVFLKEDLYVIEMSLEEEEGGTVDINGMPLEISIIMPMKITNPYVAVFKVRGWLPMITGTVQAKMRRFAANYRYKEDLINMMAGAGIEEVQEKAGIPEELRAKKGEDLWKKFWEEIEKEDLLEAGAKKKEEFVQLYGVTINKGKTRFLKIGTSPKYRELTTLEYEAEQKKKRTVIEAEAERERLKTEAEGEKVRIATVYGEIQRFDDTGRLVRSLEAMQKSPLAASMTVQAVPGLQEMLRGVFGKSPEMVSSQEIRELKEAVEKLLKEKGG